MSIKRVLRFPLRLWCAVVGHGGNRLYLLPEEEFGLYAYSRIECMRCLATLFVNPNLPARVR